MSYPNRTIHPQVRVPGRHLRTLEGDLKYPPTNGIPRQDLHLERGRVVVAKGGGTLLNNIPTGRVQKDTTILHTMGTIATIGANQIILGKVSIKTHMDMVMGTYKMQKAKEKERARAKAKREGDPSQQVPKVGRKGVVKEHPYPPPRIPP